MSSSILYISYDGILEPLGQSQVLAYLERIGGDRAIHLISYEKREDWLHQGDHESLRARMKSAGIEWYPLRYHKRPSALATSWDIVHGTLVGIWLALRHRIGIIHARSYVPAVAALTLKRLLGVRFIFDMRGFWADERVDGGLWPRDGRMYRVAKWFERRFLLQADHVVSLTHAAVAEMQTFDYLQGRMPPVTVIPTCADLERFRPRERPAKDGDSFVLGYVGSAGTWYLFDQAVACFVELSRLRPDARLLVVNRNEHSYIRERLVAGGASLDRVEIRAATHAEIPEQMARMDAGVFFIKPVFSKQASAPTKLAEFLGCGIPCLSNTGVGDMATVLEGDGVGIPLEGFAPAILKDGLSRLLALADDPDTAARCVASARRHFSLSEGVTRYRAVYHALDSTR